MSDGLRELLTDRLAEEDMAPEIPISVAELHRRLLPYALCRQRLGFASKAEYDIGFLKLLVDDESLHVPEVALLKAARDELESPEPGLALLQRFAASEVRLRARPSGSTRKSPETGPPIAELETGRSRGDHLPGLDDPLLVPQDESADALGRVATVETTASDAPPDEIILKFKPQTDPAIRTRVLATLGARRTVPLGRTGALLVELASELKLRLDEARIELTIPQDPPAIRADRTRLYQLFSPQNAFEIKKDDFRIRIIP